MCLTSCRLSLSVAISSLKQEANLSVVRELPADKLLLETGWFVFGVQSSAGASSQV